jgi:hypothetical protein
MNNIEQRIKENLELARDPVKREEKRIADANRLQQYQIEQAKQHQRVLEQQEINKGLTDTERAQKVAANIMANRYTDGGKQKTKKVKKKYKKHSLKKRRSKKNWKRKK